MRHRAFATRGDLAAWLERHHASSSELWVRVFKKASGESSVTWNDCVVEAIAWGWIDGQRKSLDDVSYLQRLTPRRPKSDWSRRNRDHAERLIAEGRMTEAGLRHVREARADGRWERAYAGQADMTIPRDFLDALEPHPRAREFFATLDRRNLFAIHHRLATARTPETRARRTQRIIERLSRNERFH